MLTKICGEWINPDNIVGIVDAAEYFHDTEYGESTVILLVGFAAAHTFAGRLTPADTGLIFCAGESLHEVAEEINKQLLENKDAD